MDISTLSTSALSNDGAELEIRHPQTGQSTGIVIVLRGRDSKVYRKLTNEFRAKAMREKINDPVEAAETKAIDSRVACTVTWRGMEKDGKEWEFSAERARELYTDEGYAWLVDQIDTFIQDRANFLPKA